MEKVSVIIPTYKRPRFIERAMKSVLDQSYENIELIVVDDNDEDSEDRSFMEELMLKYAEDSRVVYLKHKVNKNGAAARNTGIKAATGKYIAFLDDDDFYLKDRIKMLVTYAETKHPDYDLFYTGAIVLEHNKLKKIKYASMEGSFSEDILSQKSVFATGSNLFFTKSSLEAIHGFDESFRRHQDLETLVRFFEHGFQAAFIPQPYVVKFEDDRGNVPDIGNILMYRMKFLDTFQPVIEKYNRARIYNKNYYNVLVYAIRGKAFKQISAIKEAFRSYGARLSVKDRIKLFLELADLVLPVSACFRLVRNRKAKRHLADDIKREIKENFGIS